MIRKLRRDFSEALEGHHNHAFAGMITAPAIQEEPTPSSTSGSKTSLRELLTLTAKDSFAQSNGLVERSTLELKTERLPSQTLDPNHARRLLTLETQSEL